MNITQSIAKQEEKFDWLFYSKFTSPVATITVVPLNRILFVYSTPYMHST